MNVHNLLKLSGFVDRKIVLRIIKYNRIYKGNNLVILCKLQNYYSVKNILL